MSDAKKKILYVDDEAINVRLFELSFKGDFCVYTATSAYEALEILKSNGDIRLLISDLRMPEMDGLELIREVKSADPAMVCMLLTGYVESDVLLEGFNKDLIFRYLTKPWHKNTLTGTIREAFGKSDL